MKTQYFEHIDQIVLVCCMVFTIINTLRLVHQATVPVRKIAAFFVVFGPTAIATFMGVGHLLENTYHAGEKILAGAFEFNFRFYSLILMGLVILTLGVRMLNHIAAWFRGIPGSQRNAIKTALLIVAISAPTGLFTPIGYVPSIACAISLLAFPFAVKKAKSARKEFNHSVVARQPEKAFV